MALRYYPCFLSGSVQFFLLTLLFFVNPLISSLWREQWWAILRFCCCCLFSAVLYSLGLKVSDQVRADTAPYSPWLYWARSGGYLQIKLQPLGGATDSGYYTQLTCILFYCQIMMTVFANITKKWQTTALILYSLSYSCMIQCLSIWQVQRSICLSQTLLHRNPKLWCNLVFTVNILINSFHF